MRSVTMFGSYKVDATFETRLNQTYMSALNSGKIANTYRAENSQEYWAEGVQDYFDTNAQVTASDGVHNSVNTRPELLGFDPALHALIEEVFPPTLSDWEDCHRAR